MTPRLLLAAALFVLGGLTSVSSAGQVDAKSDRFLFQGGPCTVRDPPSCSEGVGADWTPSEIAQVEAMIGEIERTDIGRRIVAQVLVVTGRPAVFRRFRTAPGNAEANASFDHETKRVEIPDQFFWWLGIRDEYSGAPGDNVDTLILLHELFHAIDGPFGRYSVAGRVFRIAVGQEILTPAEKEAHGVFVASQRQLFAARELPKLQREDRKFGLSLSAKAFPSGKALTNELEGFAEIGAYLVLDPNARTYLKPSVVAFFDERIFGSKSN
jgi:hypothetical protein